ncbi:DNase1 protein [Whalleya microplaca]|nr:DNase1 protein [Whalleya microplaca]
MRFFSQIAAFGVAAATLAHANSITFINQDDTTRKVVFTPSIGHEQIDSFDIKGNDEVKIDIPTSWIGNAYSVSEGAQDTPGMLAEVTFQGWNDLTYFDVSAIVNAADHDGVKEMFPLKDLEGDSKSAISGCAVFPCAKAYYHPDDIQTVSTPETDLVCTLGTASDLSTRQDVEPKMFPRNYVLGKL